MLGTDIDEFASWFRQPMVLVWQSATLCTSWSNKPQKALEGSFVIIPDCYMEDSIITCFFHATFRDGEKKAVKKNIPLLLPLAMSFLLCASSPRMCTKKRKIGEDKPWASAQNFIVLRLRASIEAASVKQTPHPLIGKAISQTQSSKRSPNQHLEYPPQRQQRQR